MHGFVELHKKSPPTWTGRVELVPSMLDRPLRWKKPRRIFVNSMSDLFHEKLGDDEVDRVFAVMALAPQHTFQVLTKRPHRMWDYFDERTAHCARLRVKYVACNNTPAARLDQVMQSVGSVDGFRWPLPNVWLGVSVEDQATADERIPLLLQTPAAVRFVSYEPALGPVEFHDWIACAREHDGYHNDVGPFLDWIIAGGESGPGARPAHPDWFRKVRDDCKAAGLPYFHKQNGEWVDCIPADVDCGHGCRHAIINRAGQTHYAERDQEIIVGYGGDTGNAIVARVGKKKAGRLLDGREHSEFP